MYLSIDVAEYSRGIRSSIEKLRSRKNTFVDDCVHVLELEPIFLHMYSNVLLTVSYIPTAKICSFRIIYVFGCFVSLYV